MGVLKPLHIRPLLSWQFDAQHSPFAGELLRRSSRSNARSSACQYCLARLPQSASRVSVPSKRRPRRTCEWQVSGDESGSLYGSARPSADGDRNSAGVSNAAETGRSPRGRLGEAEPQGPVPVSGRSCGPAIDPKETYAASISPPSSCRSGSTTGTRRRPRSERHTSAGCNQSDPSTEQGSRPYGLTAPRAHRASRGAAPTGA